MPSSISTAPVKEFAVAGSEIPEFDPSQPFEVDASSLGKRDGEVPEFDPSQPFEVDASTVGNPKEMADQMASGISDIIQATTRFPAPLAKLLLRVGGKKTDMALNTLFPIAGGAVGTLVTPGVGTAAGGGLGGAAGESIVQVRQILRGERENFSPGSIVGSGTVSAFVPKPLAAVGGSLAKGVGKAVIQRGTEGAFLGAAQEAIHEVIDEGKVSMGDIAEHGMWGSVFGAAFGSLEKGAPALWKAIRDKPPKVAAKILRENPAPEAQTLANQIDENLGIGESPKSAAESAARFDEGAAVSAQAFKEPTQAEIRATDFEKAKAEDLQQTLRTGQISEGESVTLGTSPEKNQITVAETRRGESAAEKARLQARIDEAAPVVDDGTPAPNIELSPQAQRIYDRYGFVSTPVITGGTSAAAGAGGFLYGFSTSEDKSPEGRLKNALATGAVYAGLTYGGIKGARGIRNMISEEATLKLRQKFVDDAIRTRKMVETVGAKVTDDTNPYQKYRLMWGRVGTAINNKDQFATKLVEDMTASAKKAGVDPTQFGADVNGYLQARHAPERNAALGDGAAGMTNQQAADALVAIDASPHGKAVKEFADTIQDFNKVTLDVLRDGQVITPELYAELRARYPNHVPLNRITDADKDVAQVMTGRGFSVRNSGLVRAKGSDLPVDDILGNVLTNYEQAVMRAEKNRVDLATLGFARNNQQLGLFTEIPSNQTWKKTPPNVLELRENGKPTFLQINDPVLAPVILSMQREKLTGLLKFIPTFTRLYSGLNTRFNVEFQPMNKARDLQEMFIYLAAQKDIKAKGALGALTHDFKSMKDVFDGIRGNDTPGARLYRQMQEDGGTTGGMALSTRSETQQSLEDLWKQASSPSRTGARKAIELIDDWNAIFEDSTRLSAYKQALDSGASRDRAAFIAKESTLDFNKMGTAGPVVNALYMFSNASIIGSAKMIRTMVLNPKVGAGVVATVGAAVWATNEWNDSIDPEWRTKVRKNDTAKGLTVLVPSTEGNFRYVTIPASIGIRPIKVMAQAAYDVMSGTVDGADVAGKIGASVIESGNPVGGHDIVSALVPTILDLPVDIARNTSSLGGKIAPDSDRYAPDSTRYFASLKDSSLGRGAIAATRKISEATQGNVEISPANVVYAINQLAGGAGRFGGKVVSTAKALTQGDEFPARDIPFTGQFYSDVPPGDQDKFQSNPDLDAALTEQSRERFYERDKADEFLRNLDKIPPERRQAALDSLTDDEYDAVIRVAEKQSTSNEISKIKQLSTKTGARALFIQKALLKLPPEGRQAYYEELDAEGLIDDDTYEQLNFLLEGQAAPQETPAPVQQTAPPVPAQVVERPSKEISLPSGARAKVRKKE